LGDKVAARRIAQAVGAPLAPGTDGPVADASEAAAFAAEYGLPIAIKAAFGGGGRGLKVARTADEIEAQFESAVLRGRWRRSAAANALSSVTWTGPGTWRPSAWPTPAATWSWCPTRDCSLQRRHQKLVEEAPAPFLSGEQEELLRSSSKAILREAGYTGAGTCEFLVGQDGTISFLEVNTRLQVEHPVTEEVSGIDLCGRCSASPTARNWATTTRRCAGTRSSSGSTPRTRGATSCPRPGRSPPGGRGGAGVRLDAGYAAGMTVPQAFDSLIAKLIVTGADREQALQRSRRALAEFDIGGMPTVLPFHRR